MHNRLILLRLLGVSGLWGLNYVASAYLLREFSPIILSYSRLAVTSLFLIGVTFVSGRTQRPTRRQWGLLIGAGIFGTLCNQFFYFTGLQSSTAGNAALIIALSPVATALLARIFLRESITWSKWIGALIAFTGVAVIVLFGSHAVDGVSRGDIYLLLAMLALSVSLLFISRLSASMPSYDVTILSTVIGTVLMTPAAIWEGGMGQLHVSGHAVFWVILAAAAIFGQGLSGFWWNQGISAVGASTSSMFMNIPPFVAILASHVLLGDPIRGLQLLGGALILAGVALSNNILGRRRAAPDSA